MIAFSEMTWKRCLVCSPLRVTLNAFTLSLSHLAKCWSRTLPASGRMGSHTHALRGRLFTLLFLYITATCTGRLAHLGFNWYPRRRRPRGFITCREMTFSVLHVVLSFFLSSLLDRSSADTLAHLFHVPPLIQNKILLYLFFFQLVWTCCGNYFPVLSTESRGPSLPAPLSPCAVRVSYPSQ